MAMGIWISALALLVSIISALLSWRSGKTAARALAISERQEKRRQPKLGIYLANGYRRIVPERQVFGVLVSVTNPTDTNNSVARAELQITYLLENDVEAVCRLQHNPTLAENATNDDPQAATVLALPVRIDAHQTVSGWLLFSLENDLIGKGSIDGQWLILEDTHGVEIKTGEIPMREWTDEANQAKTG